MKYVLDTHTHTLASGHAYSTIREMAKAASEKGLELLGITEHGPQMPASCQEIYFNNLKVLPREYYGVEMLFGCELSICDFEGHVDMSENTLKNMDVVIASIHKPCISNGTKEDYTRAYINALKNPHIHILGHPDDGRFPSDYAEVVKYAKEYRKIIEINNHSLSPQSFRVGGRENNMRILEQCAKYQVPVVVGSDAHVDVLVGSHENAYQLIEEFGFPEELVVNQSVEMLKSYLK